MDFSFSGWEDGYLHKYVVFGDSGNMYSGLEIYEGQ